MAGQYGGDPLAFVRAACSALPDVTERPSHGAPTWFVKDRRAFVMYLDDHHGDGRLALWCAAPPGAQEALTASGDGYFVPPYVGHRGWVGVRLDRTLSEDEVREACEEAYRVVAAKR
jgi:predicted DNA-binding protein (MmcQ/YjbR family)